MDTNLLLFLNGLRTPWLDGPGELLSSYGLYAFPLMMLLALFRHGRAAARGVLDGWLAWSLATFIGETIVKPIVARPRPTADAALRALVDVLGRPPPPTSLAFPSGTAAAAFAGATWIALRWGARPGAFALGFATLVSLSRVYAGLHWPSDILGGAIVGALTALALDRVVRSLEPKRDG